MVVGGDDFRQRILAVSGSASDHEEDSAMVWRQPRGVDDVRAILSASAARRICVRPFCDAPGADEVAGNRAHVGRARGAGALAAVFSTVDDLETGRWLDARAADF